MDSTTLQRELTSLERELDGELRRDDLTRKAFSTDASVYQQLPVAVAFPKTEADIAALIALANRCRIGLIPRTAGTSLAGQVVGSGIVVDVSRYMNRILEVDKEKRWARVQPGVIRDELNMHLAETGLFFAPETSTSNRAMIGGMFGNNSCGANSIVYGTTRENVISTRGFLASGEFAEIGPLDGTQLKRLLDGESNSTADRVTKSVFNSLSDPAVQQSIRSQFPKPSVTRRNTGYAVDRMLDAQPFRSDGQPFNLCKLLAGSEGTLFFSTEIQVHLHPLPARFNGLYCPHFRSVDEAMRATQIIMRHQVFHCELIDRLILEGASRNPQQRQHMQYFSGDPTAVLIVEIRSESENDVAMRLRQVQNELENSQLGYHHPTWFGEAIGHINEVRRAGLGVVANVVGDDKPTTVIEDTAVSIDDLPDYIREVEQLLQRKYESECVYYGHAGAGELHLRPVLNLKTPEGVARFRDIAFDVAKIVKRFGGSLSGEHGDGRLRAELLPLMIGEDNYQLLKKIKSIWDPNNIFNPGKVVDAPLMSESLRYSEALSNQIPTIMDFSRTGSLLQSAEMCNGVGECRKSHLSGGVMCPSYMATRDEIHSTRARANILRQTLSAPLSGNMDPRKQLADPEVYRVMDLCLSCKACKSECPSNVDVAKMKAEFLQAWHDANGVPLRTRIVTNIERLNRWGSYIAPLANWIGQNRMTGRLLKRIAGFHPDRSLPHVHRTSFRKWFERNPVDRDASNGGDQSRKRVFLFCDEFTNYNDVPVGIAAVQLLRGLDYHIEVPRHLESGRASISNGLLRRAQNIADRNIEMLAAAMDGYSGPLVGIEPSAILTLRDEYPDLVSEFNRARAKELADRIMTIDEFISSEMTAGRIDSSSFTTEIKQIRLHGHCHQRALSSMRDTIRMLQLPRNYTVKMIPSGCCGMAGSFGYEREHFGLSQKIGELVLFPAIRAESPDSIIAAPGTSCRHQILDGTGRKADHPVQILNEALVPPSN